MKFLTMLPSKKVALAASLTVLIGAGLIGGASAAQPKAAPKPAQAPSPFTNAKNMMAKGQFTQAAGEIEKILAVNEQNKMEGEYLLGEVYFKAGNHKKARKYLRTVVRTGRGSAYAQKANLLLMKLPKDFSRPRTGAETRMLASMFGIAKLRGANDTPRPTVIDFYASWCQPCRDMDKVLEKAKKEYGEKITIMKVDIDDPKNDQLVEQYEVSPIPTVIFLNADGEVVTYAIGYAENNVSDGLKKILTPG